MPSFGPFPLPPLVAGQLYQVTMVGRIYGQRTRTKFRYYSTTIFAPSTLSDLVGAFRAQREPNILAALSRDWAVERYEAVALTAPSAAPYILNLATPVPGARAVDGEAQVVAVTINRKTAFAGRHGKGHVNLPGIAEDDVSNGGIAAGAIAAFDLVANGLKTDLTAGAVTWNPVLAYYTGTPPVVVWHYAVVINAELNPVLGTQRSRKIGRGE